MRTIISLSFSLAITFIVPYFAQSGIIIQPIRLTNFQRTNLNEDLPDELAQIGKFALYINMYEVQNKEVDILWEDGGENKK